MRRRPYRIRWLAAEDAARIAAIEGRGHSAEHRSGTQLIWAQLAEKDEHGGNLSLGMFLGSRLVGYLLAFAMRSRAEIAEFFDAPVPEGLDPHQPSLYVSDFVVLPAHRQGAGLIAVKFGEVVASRSDLRHLPLDAFGTDTYAEIWTERAALFRRLGWRLARRHPFQDHKLQCTLHWLQFDRIRRPRDRFLARPAVPLRRRVATRVVGIESLRDWRSLRHSWNELLRASREANVLQSYEYLSCWYKHVGILDPLRIRVQMRGEEPEAVALLRRVEYSSMGVRRVMLGNLKDDSGGICCPLIVGATATVSTQPLVDDLLSGERDWDSLRLAGLSRADLARWVPLIESHADFWVSTARESGWSSIAVNGGGEPLPGTEEGGDLHLGAADSAAADLERFVLLERADEDAMPPSAVAASSARLSLHRELAQRHAATLGMNCAFLERGGRTLAGLLGFDWNGTFLVTHVMAGSNAEGPRRLAQMLGGLRNALARRGTCASIVFDPAAVGSFGFGVPGESHAVAVRQRTAMGTVLHAAEGLRSLLGPARRGTPG